MPATREGTSSRHATIQGPTHIGKGTTIGPNTVISGPVIIGNDFTDWTELLYPAQYKHWIPGNYRTVEPNWKHHTNG